MNMLASPSPANLPKADLANAASALQNAKNRKTVHDSAIKFEAMFMQEMVGHMFAGLETDGPFGGGNGEDVFRSLMVEEYGKKIATSGQTKIAQTLEAEMLRMQEQQQNPNKPISIKQYGV